MVVIKLSERLIFAGFVPAQVVAVLLATVGLAFAPPTQGRMLLVPLTASAAAKMIPVARAYDALLLGTGPFGGSLVVEAPHDGLVSALFSVGVIAVAAPPALCGDLSSNGDAL